VLGHMSKSKSLVSLLPEKKESGVRPRRAGYLGTDHVAMLPRAQPWRKEFSVVQNLSLEQTVQTPRKLSSISSTN